MGNNREFYLTGMTMQFVEEPQDAREENFLAAQLVRRGGFGLLTSLHQQLNEAFPAPSSASFLTSKLMSTRLHDLKEFTKDCREDMHEPDEQGITCEVVGNHLDNAQGERDGDEYVVVLRRQDDEFRINLATLIAFARRAS